MMNLRTIVKNSILLAGAALTLAAATGSVSANTFTVINNCGYTVYPGLYPAVYNNGGWSMAPGSSVSFGVATNFNGRIWGRQGCNSASPAQCSSGSCGGSGLQCAGTTGQLGTSLAEFNLNANGTDWYDVSYVDGQDTPIGITVSNGSCVQPNVGSKISCPTTVQNGVDCLSPCTQTGNPAYCCSGSYNTPQTCQVSTWPANDQAYVNNIHSSCPHTYAYAYDDNIGLLTCPTGGGNNYTITFCPGGSSSTGGGTTGGGGVAPSSGIHTLTPGCATGSRLDDNAAGTANGTKIQIWTANGSAAQQWNFASVGTNTWNLAVNLGPYCLDGGAAQVGTPAQLWSCNGTADQAWVSGPAAQSGAYNFASKQSGLCLDVSGAGSANGTVVQSYTCNGTAAQAWYLN
jgi:hypothetical protein